ncbi:MAG: hypothetical protein Phog2KO_38540 [Phototrophicaceae bacterium]
MITLTENVELVPHIQIIPKHFRVDKSDFKPTKKNKKNKKSTQKQRREQEEKERLVYWNESLQQADIEDVPLLIPNIWHVALCDINHDSLYQYILSVRRKDNADKSNVWGGIILHSILGGLSLCVDGEIIYQPTCCSDLSNISDWRRAADDKNQKWEMLWNGHPWLYSRYRDGLVILTGLTENDSPPDEGKYAIDPQYFNQVVSRAEKRLAYFKQRIMTYWDENKYTM